MRKLLNSATVTTLILAAIYSAPGRTLSGFGSAVQQEITDYKGNNIVTSFGYGTAARGSIAESAQSTVKETKEIIFQGKLLSFTPKDHQMETEEQHFKGGTLWFTAKVKRAMTSMGGLMTQEEIGNLTNKYEFNNSMVLSDCNTIDNSTTRRVAESHLLKYEKGGYMVVKEIQYDNKGSVAYTATLKRDPATVRVIEVLAEKGKKIADFHCFETTVSEWPIGD